ncbi:MAG: hypothetical protein U0837_13305 [Dehalococcoidia bacterium]
MLSPYRVLDLTDRNAQLGPMMLADLGADGESASSRPAASNGMSVTTSTAASAP